MGMIGILIFVIFILLLKIYLLQKGAEEICAGLARSLTEDTNILIDISTRNPHMRKLAARINGQLVQLRRERHRCQQGDQELKEAVTNISHDLRTPLTAICGYLDLLEKEQKSEAVTHYLTQIRNRTEALTKLTEELFRYSIVTSVQELHPQRMDVVQALEESLISFYAVMQEKNIVPRIDLPEESVYRELDGDALNRVFSNIIGNALKYSDGDFAVSMTNNCCIVFSNTAKSLTPVMAGRLFDRFYTVEAGRNSTGLGLSIARLLVERMGGKIRAEYREDTLHIKMQL